MSQFSIRQLTTRYSLTALAIIVLVSVLGFFIARTSLQEESYENELASLQMKADSITHLVDFYRNVVKNLARQNSLVDMATFSDNAEIQRWATNMQDTLPSSIGLSLFDENGNILGNPVNLRLGDQCIDDIHKFMQHQSIANPPVHNSNKLFEHFDVVENITDNDEVIGVLFASFSLNTMQKELERITEPHQKLVLLSANDQLIASVDNLNSKPDFELGANIDNTDWRLQAYYKTQSLGPLVIVIVLMNAIALIMIYVILYSYSHRLITLFSKDFHAIQTLLQRVKNHKPASQDIEHSQLIETQEIVINIEHLANDISQLIDVSTTDELTGIYNRRALKTEIIRYIQLAHRGIEISAVVIDIDYFKQANDNYGHLVGDKILSILGDILSEVTRETDICARLGGDEFVAILINSNDENMYTWYERLTNQFNKQQYKQIPELADAEIVCNLSAGFTTILKTDNNIQDILSRADDALYQAKSAGRGNIKGFQNHSKK